MLSFKDQQLDEFAFLFRVVNAIKNKIKQSLRFLGFGRTVRIPLGSYMSEDVDFKSRLGYLSEYATAMELSKIIDQAGGRLTQRSTPAHLTQLYNKKKQELVALKAPATEISRQEGAGLKMGDQIFKDAIYEAEDFPALTFDIELTGDSGKGVTKADLVLSITKDNQKQIVDRIMASLKAYKTAQINLANSTYISLFKNLFYDNQNTLPRDTGEFINKFVKDYGSMTEIRELYRLQNIIGDEIKGGATKADARKTAKATHGDVIELTAKIFAAHYKTHKKEVNERMLKILGFDGEDDFYAAIGKTGDKQAIISSRASRELQAMMQQLKAGFNLTIERNGTTNNAHVKFIGINGQLITQANITFADTGGKYAQGKSNAFVDFKQFVRK